MQRQKKKEEALARFLEDSGVKCEREVTINFCGEGNKRSARVDFVVYRDWGAVLLELDEDQHKHYSVRCDVSRMLDLLASHVKANRGDKLKLIRFNPDAFSINGRVTKVATSERRAQLPPRTTRVRPPKLLSRCTRPRFRFRAILSLASANAGGGVGRRHARG